MPETCSVCKTSVPKCMLKCDNMCGKIYCSDLCSDSDDYHGCGGVYPIKEPMPKESFIQKIRDYIIKKLTSYL